jgi:hypothetical protein
MILYLNHTINNFKNESFGIHNNIKNEYHELIQNAKNEHNDILRKAKAGTIWLLRDDILKTIDLHS